MDNSDYCWSCGGYSDYCSGGSNGGKDSLSLSGLLAHLGDGETVSSLGVLYRFLGAGGYAWAGSRSVRLLEEVECFYLGKLSGWGKHLGSFLRLFEHLMYLNKTRTKMFYTKTTSLHHDPSGILQRAHTV